MAADLVGWFEAQLRVQVMLAFFLPGMVYLADGRHLDRDGRRPGSRRRGGGRELLTGLVIGVALGRGCARRWGSLSLLAACSTATLAAMSLPWLLDRLGLDPVFGSGPLATVVQDLLSIVIYFAISTAVVDTRTLTMVRAEDLAQTLPMAISVFGAVAIVLALRRLAFDLRLLDLFARGGQPPNRVLLGMPPYLQHVCSRFQMSHSLSSVARLLDPPLDRGLEPDVTKCPSVRPR